jgi:hypothetical protein
MNADQSNPEASSSEPSGPHPGPDPRSLPPQVSIGMAILTEGLQRGLAWARRSIVEPHATHTDPSEQPDCVLCVALLALQGVTQPSTPGEPLSAFNATSAQPVTSSITWVPVRRVSGSP